ncbi:MAG: Bug family tripartite tricarboxylate transporter substrate binding protein, partial [Pigmentiphaga sp.]
RKVLVGALALSSGASASEFAPSESYPSRPITIVSPYAPGGAVDVMSRLLATKLSEQLRVAVIVKNVAGASGTIGMSEVARSPADGYTLLYTPSTIAIFPALFRNLNFDPMKDLVPVSQFISSAMLIAVHPDTEAKSIEELVALAKANPGELNFGSAGVADTLQLGIEMFKVDTGTDMLAVPYRGQGPMMIALLGGEVDLGLLSVQTALPSVRQGALRALGVTGATRSAALPEVPTVGETVSGYELTSWHGVFAPVGTPSEVVERIQLAIAEVTRDPSVRKIIEDAGNEVVGSTPEAFKDKFTSDIEMFSNVVKQAELPMQD